MEILLLIGIFIMLIYAGYEIYIKDNPYEIINVENIRIKENYHKAGVSTKKMQRKDNFYKLNGYFEDRIILNKNNVLLDGYSTYLLLLHYQIKQVEVIRDKNRSSFE